MSSLKDIGSNSNQRVSCRFFFYAPSDFLALKDSCRERRLAIFIVCAQTRRAGAGNPEV